MNTELSETGSMRKQARMIFDAAVRAVDPEEAILRHLKLADEVLIVGESLKTVCLWLVNGTCR
jgi:hypothetical protein